MPITTLHFLEQIDHALDGMHNGDILRSAEINNIQCSIKMAIREFAEQAPDAEDFAQEMIALLRDRIDHIAANPQSAGYAEQFRTEPLLPPPPEDEQIPDTERSV